MGQFLSKRKHKTDYTLPPPISPFSKPNIEFFPNYYQNSKENVKAFRIFFQKGQFMDMIVERHFLVADILKCCGAFLQADGCLDLMITWYLYLKKGDKIEKIKLLSDWLTEDILFLEWLKTQHLALLMQFPNGTLKIKLKAIHRPQLERAFKKRISYYQPSQPKFQQCVAVHFQDRADSKPKKVYVTVEPDTLVQEMTRSVLKQLKISGEMTSQFVMLWNGKTAKPTDKFIHFGPKGWLLVWKLL